MKLQTSHWSGTKPVGIVWTAAVLAAALFLPVAAYGGGVVTTATETALNNALNGGGTVTFACNGVINITGPKNIVANTVLDATGHAITISGQGNVRHFVVNNGVSLTLVNLTLANGRAFDYGGAVYNSGTLTANSCTFTNNTARGSVGSTGGTGSGGNNGGPGGPGGAGGSVKGGVIYNAGSASLTNCILKYNSAVGGAGGAGGTGGSAYYTGGNGGDGGPGGTAYGGAVYSINGLSVSNCVIGANSVTGGNGGAGGAGGIATGPNGYNGGAGDGGQAAEGSGAGFYTSGSSTMVSSTFFSNVGTGGSSPATFGTYGAMGRNGKSGGNSYGGGL